MWPFSLLRNRSNRRRAIFRFFGDGRWHYVDPLVAWRVLTTHPQFSWEEDPIAADAGDIDAMERTAQAAREAFGLDPLNPESGRGYTQSEAIDILIDYTLWTNGVKKNTNKQPILSQAMESPRPSTSNSNSDSTSTSAELKSAEPSTHSMP